MSLCKLASTLGFLFSLLVGLCCVNATAQHFDFKRQDKSDPCPDAITQLEINRCAGEQFKKSDKSLNVAYKRIMSKLGSTDRANLIEAQRAWLKYRNSNCWAMRQFHGGSLAPTNEAFCLQDLTEARIRELIEIYEPPDK